MLWNILLKCCMDFRFELKFLKQIYICGKLLVSTTVTINILRVAEINPPIESQNKRV